MKTLNDDGLYPIIHLQETTSTNSYLADLCEVSKLAEFTTVIADFQTIGRGQRGNTWESSPYKNLLFSILLFPDFVEARHQFYISQIVSLAVKNTLDQYTNEMTIKWPNDIYWKDQKIGGILIEHTLTGTHIDRSIIGIGLNINQEKFHSSAPNPISLYQITQTKHSLSEILDQIIEQLRVYYDSLREGNIGFIAQSYHQSLFRKEGWHPYADKEGRFEGKVVEVKPSGELIIEKKTGEIKAYQFKEVQQIINPNQNLFRY